MNLRISPSKINAFRDCKRDAYLKEGENADTRFFTYLEGGIPSSPAQRRGTAFHLLCEKGERCGAWYEDVGSISDEINGTQNPKHFVVESEGERHYFTRPQFEEAARLHLQFGCFPFEVEEELHFSIGPHEVRMKLRCDFFTGMSVHDIKTSAMPCKSTEFTDALQWHCYMLAFPEAQSFCWHHYQWTADGGIKATHFQAYRRDDHREIVHSWMGEMVRFLEANEKIHLILDK